MRQTIKAFVIGGVVTLLIVIVGSLAVFGVLTLFVEDPTEKGNVFLPAIVCIAAFVGGGVAAKTARRAKTLHAVAVGLVFGIFAVMSVIKDTEIALGYRLASALFLVLPAGVGGFLISTERKPAQRIVLLRFITVNRLLVAVALVVLPILGYPYARMFPDARVKKAAIVGDIDLGLTGPARSFAKLKGILKEDPKLYEQRYKLANYRKADFAGGIIIAGILIEGDVTDKVIDITVKRPFKGSIEGIRIGQSIEEAQAGIRQGFKLEKSEYDGAVYFTKDRWNISPKLGADRRIVEIEMGETGYTSEPMLRP